MLRRFVTYDMNPYKYTYLLTYLFTYLLKDYFACVCAWFACVLFVCVWF